MSASFLNFELYCKSEYAALMVQVYANINDYVDMHKRAYGSDTITQLLSKDYNEGYRKYGDLWCANIASMAKAMSENYSLVEKP